MLPPSTSPSSYLTPLSLHPHTHTHTSRCTHSCFHINCCCVTNYICTLTFLDPPVSTTVASVTSLWSPLGPQVSQWLTGGVAKTTSRQYISKVADWTSFCLAQSLTLCANANCSLETLMKLPSVPSPRLLRSSSHIKRTLQPPLHDLIKELYTARLGVLGPVLKSCTTCS